MRVITLGSDSPHPLTRAALAVVGALESIEHVDHLTAMDERAFLRDARSPAYRAHIAGLEPDLLVSAAYARIVPDDVLAIPKLGAINVHPSLLPDYRGVAAVWWALYEGCSAVGVTVHEMTTPVDTGPILGQASLDVSPDAEAVAVWRRLGELAQPLLKDVLERILTTGQIAGVPQPEGGSYRSKPHKELRRLEVDWSRPALELVRRERIFPGCGNIPVLRWRIFIRRVELGSPTAHPPGSILHRRLSTLEIAAGEGTSVRLELARPVRDWVKLSLFHLSTGQFRRLSSANESTSLVRPSSANQAP